VSDLAVVVAVAAITYGTRVAFLLRPRSVPEGALGRFLDVFPLALFVAIAMTGLAAPDGDPAVTPALAAALGGVIGAVVFRRNLWAVLVVGMLFFYITRALTA
jgi:branched-subunit amino acid transport protein